MYKLYAKIAGTWEFIGTFTITTLNQQIEQCRQLGYDTMLG